MSAPRFTQTPTFTPLPLIAALAGCAADKPPLPTVPPPPKPLSGEQILRESQGMAQLGQRYVEGENMVKQGEDLIRQGQTKVAEGERLMDQGRQIMRESEQGYGALKK